jgi:hypothetical protein
MHIKYEVTILKLSYKFGVEDIKKELMFSFSNFYFQILLGVITHVSRKN